MPGMDVVLNVAKFVDEMRKAGTPPTGQDLNRLTMQVAKGFGVTRNEVAILRLSPESRVLTFLFPLRLAAIGSIPITAIHSLAAKTIRDKRGDIVNNFASYKHPTVFESVSLSEEESAAPIQKIMSSPMIVEGKIVGVIQISRKGRTGRAVGPDFTQEDLTQLATVGSIIGKYLSELAPISLLPQQTTIP